MCGIAGCVAPMGEAPDRRALERMARALGHRGPDDQGVEVIGSVGLVHTRLAIVDPSPAGHEPMEHAGWWLTYNGEVFNHAELRERLPAGGWRGGSDAETLLRALAEWGEEAVPLCNGLFAYAALDTRGRRLLLVRDRFGVKPLYVARHSGSLWFASEMRALLEAGVPRLPEPDVLGHAVRYGWANGRLTPVRGIERVPPGTLVSVELDSLASRERRWYDPLEAVDRERMAVLGRLPRAEAAAAVEQELRASVRRRLMADVPVGTMCSGGIDSSLITAMARDEQPGIRAYNASIGDQPDYDEGPWAKRVADALGVELRTVRQSADSWRADLVDVVRHVEYPLTHESSVPMAQIAGLAHSDGVKVLLSGEGADELFGGYEHLHGRERADFLARGRLPERAARAAYRRLQRLRGGVRERPTSVEEWERGAERRARAAYAHHGGPRRRLEAGLAAELETYLPHLLNRQDKSTMRASIETRVPFLDPGLVSLALNLPLEVRVEPRHKGVLRDIAERLLPEGVAQRPKLGFGFEADRYIEGAARPEFLAEGALRQWLHGSRHSEIPETPSGYDALLLWTGEIWCRVVLEGQQVDAVNEALWKSD
jgi:asparagine synthase (glutamine-hydrolysing)